MTEGLTLYRKSQGRSLRGDDIIKNPTLKLFQMLLIILIFRQKYYYLDIIIEGEARWISGERL